MKKHLKIIPNIVTFLNLFSGFLAIYFAFNNELGLASMAIMLATIFDLLDGRLARILGVSSEIGKELDSFSDLLTFGVAPAFLFFNFFTFNYPNQYSVWVLIPFSFIFVITAALRLATYNVKTDSEETVNFFTGMPSTLAGISLASFFGFNHSNDGLTLLLKKYFPKISLELPFPCCVYLAIFLLYAFLMVSKIPYAKSNTRLFNFKSFWNILYNIGFFIFLFTAFKFFVITVVVLYTISPLTRKLRAK